MKYFFFILFLLQSLMHSQAQQQTNTSEPVKLRYADNLVGTNGGNIREFLGNVQFQQGNVFSRSDRAFQYLEQNNAELIGNVVITQEDMVLKSPKVFYNGNERTAYSNDGLRIKDKNGLLLAKKGSYNMKTTIADFIDSVSVTDDTVKITADRIVYNRKTRVSFAYGNVVIEDDSVIIFSDQAEHHRETRDSYVYGNVVVKGKYQSVMLNCSTLTYINAKKYSKAVGNPVLNQIDTMAVNKDLSYRDTANLDLIIEKSLDSLNTYKFDTLSIVSDTMESYRSDGNDIYYFTGNAEMVKGGMSTKSGFAVYDKKLEIISLEKTPVVWYDSTQMHSDSITVYIPNKKLSQIHSFRNALSASRDDSLDFERINQITGDEIIISFESDTIRKMVSIGNAKSLYYLKSDTTEDGAKRCGSDTININFTNGELDNIVWLGAVQGEFYPENLVWDKPKELYLPSFRWTEKRPLKKFVKERRKISAKPEEEKGISPEKIELKN